MKPSPFEHVERGICQYVRLRFEVELLQPSLAGHGRTGICQIASARA
jgi:hypothetical protein